jgi:hypothetical protein
MEDEVMYLFVCTEQLVFGRYLFEISAKTVLTKLFCGFPLSLQALPWFGWDHFLCKILSNSLSFICQCNFLCCVVSVPEVSSNYAEEEISFCLHCWCPCNECLCCFIFLLFWMCLVIIFMDKCEVISTIMKQRLQTFLSTNCFWCRKVEFKATDEIRINVLLDCVYRPRFHKTWISQRFGDWLCPRPQVYEIRGGGRLKR